MSADSMFMVNTSLKNFDTITSLSVNKEDKKLWT